MTSRLAPALLVVVAACGAPAPAPPTPTEADAQRLLAQAVVSARARNFTALCALGGGNCEQVLDEAGRDAVPLNPPRVAGTFEVPSVRHADGSLSVGGRVLVLCGTDARGRDFRTEMLVFYTSRNVLKAIEPVYWSGGGIAESPVAGASAPPPSIAC